MAAARRNVNIKTVSKSVKYFLIYEFLKTSNLTHFSDCVPLLYSNSEPESASQNWGIFH